MNYTRKVAFNTLVQMLGKLVGTAVAMGTVALLFRYLGVNGVGKYTTIFAFVASFSILADFGLQWTLIRELSIQKNTDKVFSNIFALRLILAIIIHLLTFAVVWLFKYPLDVKYGVGVITCAYFFTTLNMVPVGVFLSKYRLDISVATEVVGRILVFILVWIFTRNNYPLTVVLSAYLFGGVLNYFLNLTFVKRFVRIRLAFDYQYWKKVFYQAVPIGIVLVFGLIYFKIDSIMLSLMKDMNDVGIYGTAYKLLEVLETIPAMFLGAAFPLITKYAVSKDERVRPAFQKQFDFLSLMALPVVSGVFVLSGSIISFISGSRGGEFINASTISVMGSPATSVTCLKILIFVVGINFFTSLYSYLVVSIGEQKRMIVPMILFALLNIVMNLILIPKYSYIGASVATIMTEVVVLAVYIRLSARLVKLPINFGTFLRLILCAGFMGLAVYFFEKIGVNLFVNIALGAMVYGVLAVVSGAVSIGAVRQFLSRS